MGEGWLLAAALAGVESARGAKSLRLVFGQHHGTGASARRRGTQKNGPAQALGRSRGGLTTKIHLAALSENTASAAQLSPGCESDFEHFPAVYEQACQQVDPKAIVTDKGFDSNAIRNQIRRDHRRVVIPSRSCRKVNLRYDKKLYRERNRIERLFNKLKHFRRIATRYEKLAKTFLACVHLALSFLCLRLIANTT